MHSWLLFKDKDTDISNGYFFKDDLIKDLNLDILLKTMARDDEITLQIVKKIIMQPLTTEEEINYRQEIILDIAEHFEHFTQIHAFLRDADKVVAEYRDINRQRQNGSKSGGASYYIDKLKCLLTLTEALQSFYPYLKEGNYQSSGMLALLARFEEELPPERITAILESLRSIEFWLEGGTVTISAAFTEGLKLGNFTINQVVNLSSGLKKKNLTLKEQITKRILKTNVTVLNEETLIQQEKMLEQAAVAWLLSSFDDYLEDMLSFFSQFSYEASFYLACASLCVRFQELGLHLCRPRAVSADLFSYQNLYDISLAIYFQYQPISNSLKTEEKRLFIVTGANQGGKSTWLRSIGTAQLLMQCGMLVPADSYSSGLYSNLFTHFTRQEDNAMNSGRFDEELKRMDQIMEHMTEDSMLLMNESFASTTEKEGSLIMKNIIDALYELNIPVFMVTHLFEFIQEMYHIYEQEHASNKQNAMIFLSAARKENGTRTFQILPAIPSHTSYGIDLFHQFFPEKANSFSAVFNASATI